MKFARMTLGSTGYASERAARQRRADALGLDRLNLVFRLAGTDEDAEAAAQHRLARSARSVAETRGWKFVFFDCVERRRVGIERAGVDVELDDPVVALPQRRVVVVAQAVVQREIRLHVPLVLREADVVLLLDVLLAGRAVVERARLAQVAEVLDRASACSRGRRRGSRRCR